MSEQERKLVSRAAAISATREYFTSAELRALKAAIRKLEKGK